MIEPDTFDDDMQFINEMEHNKEIVMGYMADIAKSMIEDGFGDDKAEFKIRYDALIKSDEHFRDAALKFATHELILKAQRENAN